MELNEQITKLLTDNSRATIDYVLQGGKLPKPWEYITGQIIALIKEDDCKVLQRSEVRE